MIQTIGERFATKSEINDDIFILFDVDFMCEPFFCMKWKVDVGQQRIILI